MEKKQKPRLSKTVVPTQPQGKPIKDMGTAELGLASFKLHNEIQSIQNQANTAIAELRNQLVAVGTELEKRNKAEK